MSLSACAVKKLAVNSLANALSESGTSVYTQDDDPEFVGDALPFGLKTMEALLQTTPKHQKLLIATASGFVQYAHAYVLRPSQALESHDLNAAYRERARAKRFFLRALGYGSRALEISYPGISKQLRSKPLAAAARVKKRGVPALYWTGVAWGSAISTAKDDMALVGDLPIVTALLERALELEEGWNDGAIHEFFIVFDSGRSEAEGGGVERAEAHFRRAMELNGGRSIGPLVSMAESVCVRLQDRQRFKKLLSKALAFDVDQYPDKRLANIFAQRRASDLLSRGDNLFFLDEPEIQEDHAVSAPRHSRKHQ
jgi:predicted anti-sigma-YlaC factor YlaD